MNTPRNDYEALVLALELALTAPDGKEMEAKEAVQFAEELASTMDEVSVERAKKEAESRAYG